MIRAFDPALLEALREMAAKAPRLRAHHNIHAELNDPVNRLLVAACPGTYVRPHRHGDKFELFLVMEGGLDLFSFDDDGVILERLSLSATGTRVAEIPPGLWHGLAVHQGGTVFMEVKPGPYRPTEEKDFASWAPPEGDHLARRIIQWMGSNAQPGDRWPGDADLRRDR